MTTPVEKRNHEKFCEFHGEVGHNTYECMHLRKQIEEMLKAGKLSHLIKELKQNNGKEQPKVTKKGETSGKDKALAILVVQPWERVVRQRITTFCFGLDELRGCKIIISIQWNYWKTGSQKITSSSVDSSQNAKHPGQLGHFCLEACGYDQRPKAHCGVSLKRAGMMFSEAEEAFKQMKQLIAELLMLTAPMEKEELIVYLAATKETVSAVLMTERKAKQMPIYLVSRALRGPILNYTSMEILVLALVHASKCLKRFEATNNKAEYEALIAGLRIAEQMGVKIFKQMWIHAHPTIIKSSNRDTPFLLTYGVEAVILAEIGMPTLRTVEVDLVGNNEALEINLDLLEERREEEAIREAKSKAKMEKYYNSKV
ncbi:reverse transcriptase domain-containing protein [Tanacetum coccineum]